MRDSKLEAVDSGDDMTLARVRDIYMVSFPEEERRPWRSLVDLLRSEPRFGMHVLRLAGAGDNGDCGPAKARVAAFLTWWRLDGFMYIEHFAVDPALRGAGLGSGVIGSFIGSLGTDACVVLEAEPEASGELAQRRIAFYRRASLRDYPDFPYIQPPYAPSLPPVPLTLMAGPAPLNPGDLDAMARSIHRHVYGRP